MVMLVAGMGDQNTFDVATRIHENELDFAVLFPESERLSYKKLVPKGRVWTDIYIDDWLCVYFLPAFRNQTARTRHYQRS